MLYISHSPLGGRVWAHPSEQREKFQQKVIFLKDLWFLLSPVQTQHCWMLHVASINNYCMYTLLEVVVQSLKLVKILAT